MRCVKSYFLRIFAFFLSIAAILLFQKFVSLPIIPCISIYLCGDLWYKNDCKILHNILLVVSTLFAVGLYGLQLYLTIIYYPDYGNFFAVIFDAVTIMSFIGACITNYDRGK